MVSSNSIQGVCMCVGVGVSVSKPQLMSGDISHNVWLSEGKASGCLGWPSGTTKHGLKSSLPILLGKE